MDVVPYSHILRKRKSNVSIVPNVGRYVSSTNIHGKTPLFILCENFSHKFVDKREHRSAVEGLVPIAAFARRKWYF